MSRLSPAGIVLIWVLVLAEISHGQNESWIGQKIMLKQGQVRLVYTDAAGRAVDGGPSKLPVLVVLKEHAGWLYVKTLDVEGWFSKSEALLLKDALAYYSARIRQNPRDGGAYFNRAAAWKERGEYPNALKDMNEALRLQPTGTRYHSRGMLHERLKQYDKALADYQQAINLDPADPINFNNPAWIRATCPDAKFRDGKKAIELATYACELTSWKAGDFLDTLAAAHAEDADFGKAVTYETQALADPAFAGSSGDAARERLGLYKRKKPYRLE